MSFLDRFKEQAKKARVGGSDGNALFADKKVADERFGLCKQCPSFKESTQQCRECGCLMKLKTRLQNASCPLGKW